VFCRQSKERLERFPGASPSHDGANHQGCFIYLSVSIEQT
jgi:hypothetical protein